MILKLLSISTTTWFTREEMKYSIREELKNSSAVENWQFSIFKNSNVELMCIVSANVQSGKVLTCKNLQLSRKFRKVTKLPDEKRKMSD